MFKTNSKILLNELHQLELNIISLRRKIINHNSFIDKSIFSQKRLQEFGIQHPIYKV